MDKPGNVLKSKESAEQLGTVTPLLGLPPGIDAPLSIVDTLVKPLSGENNNWVTGSGFDDECKKK